MLSHHTVYQISRKIRFWVNKNILTPVTYVLFKDFLWETHTAGLQVSKRKILITNKQSVKQLLQRRLLHDHLLKLNTENSVWTHFILIEKMS